MAKTKPIPRPEIGERLRKLMDDTPHLSTQMAIAKRTGIGQTTIGRNLRQLLRWQVPSLAGVSPIVR